MSHDTWLHRMVRGMVRPLARTPITPNHLTTARLLTGLAAAAAFSLGETTADRLGAGLFLASMLFDRADGELARQTGKTSRFGHVYDLVTDALSNALVFVGIGFGLVRTLGTGAIGLGLVAGVAVLAVLLMVVELERRAGEGASRFEDTAGFDPDDAMIAIPVAMALGWAVPLLYAAAIGAPVAALVVFLVLRRRRVRPD